MSPARSMGGCDARRVPATRLAALRLLVGGYASVFLLARAPSFWSAARLPARQFEPVGVLVALQRPLPVSLARGVFVLSVIVGAAFVLGWRYRITGPAFALAFLAVATYRLSFGHVIHTEHLCALHLLVLGVAPAADAWSLDARRAAGRPPSGEREAGRPAWPADDGLRGDGPIRLMALLTVVTYVLAGLAKLRHGGIEWVTGDVLRNHVAYDNLRKELLDSVHSPLGGWLVQHRAVFPPMAVLTVLVEVGAPVVLVAWRHAVTVRRGWAVAAWSLHAGIVVVMAISFPYQLSFIAYAPLLTPERWFERVVVRLRRRTVSDIVD